MSTNSDTPDVWADDNERSLAEWRELQEPDAEGTPLAMGESKFKQEAVPYVTVNRIELVTIYITYGSGTNLAGCYSRAVNTCELECYNQIDLATQGKYAFSYPESEETQEMIKRWNLKEVPLQQQVHSNHEPDYDSYGF